MPDRDHPRYQEALARANRLYGAAYVAVACKMECGGSTYEPKRDPAWIKSAAEKVIGLFTGGEIARLFEISQGLGEPYALEKAAKKD